MDSAKSLQTERAQTGSNSILISIHQSYYDSGGGDTGPISHVSSAGLMDQGVQGMIGLLRAKTIEHWTGRGWSNLVKDGGFFTNTKFQQIPGFSTLQLML